MPTLVVSHVALGAEAFATALRAGEWPLVLVNSDVDGQVLLFAEGLVTARKSALEGLRAIVQVHMCIQTNLPIEDLVATGVWADERLVTVTLYLVNRFRNVVFLVNVPGV
jgi:hypothetical protein